jgi:PadR family transcriptional regulator, regulatory protein PadR
MPDRDSIGQFLPLAPQDLQLLLALAEAPLHGYAMRKAVSAQSGGALSVELGSLYRMIHRLERDGLIGEAPDGDGEPTPGRERRLYGITKLGQAVVKAELARLESVLELAAGVRFRPRRA